jgi:hypothetical protein
VTQVDHLGALRLRIRRMMLIAASCSSNSAVDVTNRIHRHMQVNALRRSGWHNSS